jgi:hypothetical protein
MPYRNWTEQPAERRCINCDQRLVADEQPPRGMAERPAGSTVHYVCPDNHERWAYNSQSREWRQMY